MTPGEQRSDLYSLTNLNQHLKQRHPAQRARCHEAKKAKGLKIKLIERATCSRSRLSLLTEIKKAVDYNSDKNVLKKISQNQFEEGHTFKVTL